MNWLDSSPTLSGRASSRLIQGVLSLPRELHHATLLDVIECRHQGSFGCEDACWLVQDWKDARRLIQDTAKRLRLIDIHLAEDVDFVEGVWKRKLEEMWTQKISRLRRLTWQGVFTVLKTYEEDSGLEWLGEPLATATATTTTGQKEYHAKVRNLRCGQR